jgi:lysozyme
MNITKEGIKLLHDFEGCSLKAYKCPAGIFTIGFGNTYYENGAKVKPTDSITKERANELFSNVVAKFGAKVLPLLKVPLKPNQFSALVSFAYNCGIANLEKSTLLKKVNANPNDKTIALEFMKWTRANGQVLAGLERRRKAESALYFS